MTIYCAGFIFIIGIWRWCGRAGTGPSRTVAAPPPRGSRPGHLRRLLQLWTQQAQARLLHYILPGRHKCHVLGNHERNILPGRFKCDLLLAAMQPEASPDTVQYNFF